MQGSAKISRGVPGIGPANESWANIPKGHPHHCRDFPMSREKRLLGAFFSASLGLHDHDSFPSDLETLSLLGPRSKPFFSRLRRAMLCLTKRTSNELPQQYLSTDGPLKAHRPTAPCNGNPDGSKTHARSGYVSHIRHQMPAGCGARKLLDAKAFVVKASDTQSAGMFSKRTICIVQYCLGCTLESFTTSISNDGTLLPKLLLA